MPEFPNPRVSVLMTVFNAATWLRAAVDSVLAQTFTEWELVAIENGSTDQSPAILRSYTDPRVRVIAMPENIGRTPALQHALDQARGEYVAVLDADDLASPNRLARQLSFLDERADVGVVGAWVQRIDDAGCEIGTWTPPTDTASLNDRLAYENPIIHSVAMYRTALARLVGGYPAEHPYAQDFALWLRLAAHASVGMVGEVLGSHRTTAGNMTRSKETQLDVARDNWALLKIAGRTSRLSARARRRNQEEQAIATVRYAVASMRSRNWSEGLRLLWRALRDHPRGLAWNRRTRGAIGR